MVAAAATREGATPVSTSQPVGQQITLRLDADVVAWFKERDPGGRGYQTDVNRVLREHVDRTSRQETVSAA